MPRRSLRTVLTVWNAGALAGLLGIFGTAIVLANQNRMSAAINDDLAHQAERSIRLGPPGGKGAGLPGPPRNGAPQGGPSGPGGPATGQTGAARRPPGRRTGLAGTDRGGASQAFAGPGGENVGPRGGQGGPPEQGFGQPGFEGPGPGGPDGAGPDGAGPDGGGPEGGPGGGGPEGPGFGSATTGGPTGRFQTRLPAAYMEAGRLADVRRPRFFGVDGRPNPFDPVPAFDAAALREALQGRTTYSDTVYEGERIRVISMPIVREGQRLGAVQQAQELRGLDLLIQTQWRTLAAFIPLAILAAAAGAYALTARTLRPIRRLTRAAAEISHSDLSRRLEVTGEDEMAELASTFNGMLSRLQTSFTELETAYGNLARSYEQQQRFTADASHELRTPLTRLRLATSSALEESRTPEEMRRALQTADRAAASMTRLVQDLLTLAKADAGQLPLRREPVDLRVVVADALEDVSVQRPVDTGFADRPLMIQADAEHLRRVVTNLIENAARHTPVSGFIRVEALRAQNHAVVSVRDNGEGISSEHLPHIFERFYRAEKARTRQDGGSGLGLAICKNLVEAHGGRMEIESAPGVGTTVRAIFPLFSAPLLTQTESS